MTGFVPSHAGIRSSGGHPVRLSVANSLKAILAAFLVTGYGYRASAAAAVMPRRRESSDSKSSVPSKAPLFM